MAATVCVVGAGVTGCAAARELADVPGVDVQVVDRAGVAEGTTARAAGLVSLAPAYADVPAVARHATEFFRTYDGSGVAYRERPGLGLIAAGGGAARRRVDRLRGRGVDAAYLDPAAVRERFPRVRTAPLDGGVRHGHVGTLDSSALASALAADARDRGAAFRTDTAVTGLAVEDGAVRGVTAAADGGREEVCADAVVVAAGWRTEPLLRDVATLPVRPYRAQCVVVDPPTPVGDEFPVGWIPDREVYFRPWADGRLLVGGGATAVDDPAGAPREADPAFEDRVVSVLSEFFEGFDADRTRVDGGWAGVDSGTPDARPVVDAPADAPDGLVVATGFHGKGVMTAPVTATLVRALAVEAAGEGGAAGRGDANGGSGASALPRGAFSLDRFDADARSPDFRFVSIEDEETDGIPEE